MANTGTRIPQASRTAVAGLFKDESHSEQALDALRAAGISDGEVGVAAPEDHRQPGFWSKVNRMLGKQGQTEHQSDLEDSLRTSGIPDRQARYFGSEVENGGVLITVHTDAARAAKARSILESHGADVGTSGTEVKVPVARPAAQTATGAQHIQLLGEILRVHKERVPRGEVRVRKEVVTEQRNLEVPVSHEELVIERTAGKGQQAASSQVGSDQNEVRIPLSEERVRIEKKPVVNEEINVGKREVQGTKRITDKVRHEELRTEGDIKEEGNIKEEGKKVEDKTRRVA